MSEKMRLKSEYFKMQLNIFESTEESIYKDFMFTSLSIYLKLRRQTEKKFRG
jgi:hypothetical protein